ncbi:bile acid:sodium symporter family protein [Chloroflexota bacterium]
MLSKIFRNRNFILILAIVIGLTVGENGAVLTRPVVLPVLALIMTLSTTTITSREFSSIKTMPGSILIALLLNYVVTGGLILLMGSWLIDDSELWTGLVVIAAVPPAIAAVPWTYLLGGNTLFSLVSLTVTYLAALVLTPAMIIIFLGVGSIEPRELLLILGELILIPLVASRLLISTGLARRIDKWRGTIVNWGFFIVIFTVIGLNRQAFFGEFDTLLKLAIIAIVTSFGLSYAIELIFGAFHVRRETIISLIFVGTMKNFGMASGILLTLFSERAAIPTSIMIVFFISRSLWLGFRLKKNNLMFVEWQVKKKHIYYRGNSTSYCYFISRST